MCDTPILDVQIRSEFGKGAARRARRAGLVPAVVYGHGSELLHIDVPGHELFLIVRDDKNALVTLKLDGKSLLVRVQEAQRHPVTRVLLHADFLVVPACEKAAAEGAAEAEEVCAPEAE